MKFNNLMNKKKYTRSIGGSAVGAGVLTAAWAVSSDGPVAAPSASFSAWGGGGNEIVAFSLLRVVVMKELMVVKEVVVD